MGDPPVAARKNDAVREALEAATRRSVGTPGRVDGVAYATALAAPRPTWFEAATVNA